MDEPEHEGIWPFVGGGKANNAMRLKALLLSEDCDGSMTEYTTGMFDLGSNYQDGTNIPLDLTVGSIPVPAKRSFPVALSVGLFLIEEDCFGDLSDVVVTIRSYAQGRTNKYSQNTFHATLVSKRLKSLWIRKTSVLVKFQLPFLYSYRVLQYIFSFKLIQDEKSYMCTSSFNNIFSFFICTGFYGRRKRGFYRA